jgi:hypothetical protein
MQARTEVWAAAALLLLAAGCAPKVEYAPVQGTVTLDGEPLAGVSVWFFPEKEGGQDLPHATGTTDESGVYRLTSNNGKPGGVVGKHRVVVNWPLRERGTDDRSNPPPTLPPRYTQAADTPFVVEVKPGGQTIDLALKGK